MEFEREVIDRLGRIETNQLRDKATSDDHETRLRSVEKWVWKAIGALVVASAVFAFAVRLIFNA